MYIIDSQSFSNYVYVLFMIAQFPPNSERNVAYTDPDICKRDGGGGGSRDTFVCERVGGVVTKCI